LNCVYQCLNIVDTSIVLAHTFLYHVSPRLPLVGEYLNDDKWLLNRPHIAPVFATISPAGIVA
jgi:hypothetical protein